MEYKYYHQFSLSKKLAKSISSIISKEENGNFICNELQIVIPKHKGLVWSSPLDGYNPWGGGLNALSGAQMRDIDEKYGRFVEGTIEEECYDFIVVMKANAFQAMLRANLESKDEIIGALKVLNAFYIGYDGLSFDSRTLIKRFPYLETFFDDLDEWRARTGRVTLDDDVLECCTEKVLANIRQKVKMKSMIATK